MRPVSLANLPKAPTGLTAAKVGNGVLLTWTDNSLADTAFAVQRQPLGSASMGGRRRHPDVAEPPLCR